MYIFENIKAKEKEEGKKLLREYKEKSLLVGLAITPKMYDDLGRKLDEISDSREDESPKIELDKMVNKKDIVPRMWGHKPNTNHSYHPVVNYNKVHYEKKENGIHERKIDINKKEIPNLEFNFKKLINLDIEKRYDKERGDNK